MARLPYADTNSAPAAVRAAVERNPVSFLRMLAHAQNAFDPWLGYTSALLADLELDPLLREFAILEASRVRGSDYPWTQHVALARALGASAEQIAAIKEGQEQHPSLTEAQREVLRLAREVSVDGEASEEAVAAVSDRLGPRQVVELLLVTGHWLSICSLAASLDLQPDLPTMAAAVPDTLALRTTPPS
jgi:4-carboxymuconolactone decarboxylase